MTGGNENTCGTRRRTFLIFNMLRNFNMEGIKTEKMIQFRQKKIHVARFWLGRKFVLFARSDCKKGQHISGCNQTFVKMFNIAFEN